MIFDTNFIIDLMNNKKEAVEKLNELTKRYEIHTTTSLSIFELFTGLIMSKRPLEEKNKISSFLEGKTVISFDLKSAEKAGRINGELISQGNSIDLIDTMIAGITLEKKEKLLTNNIKHFSRIKGLQIETYSSLPQAN